MWEYGKFAAPLFPLWYIPRRGWKMAHILTIKHTDDWLIILNFFLVVHFFGPKWSTPPIMRWSSRGISKEYKNGCWYLARWRWQCGILLSNPAMMASSLLCRCKHLASMSALPVSSSPGAPARTLSNLYPETRRVCLCSIYGHKESLFKDAYHPFGL